MAEQVERLLSKIVQYDGNNDCALCEDGSLWCHNYREKIWVQLHPPHEKDTLAWELNEALEVLRALWSETEPDSAAGAKAYGAAARVLQKHGVPTK